MDMTRLPAILIFFLIPGTLFPEKITSKTGESFSRGSIVNVVTDSIGNPVVLLRNWDGSCGVLILSSDGDVQESYNYGKRNIFTAWNEDSARILGEAPHLLETWMFRKIDLISDKILLEIQIPEICKLVAEKGYPPETVEGYYHVTPDGKFLLAEFRVPELYKVRRRTEYYNRQVMVIDLTDGKTLFSRFFRTEQGFREKTSPRYFPLYHFISDQTGKLFLMAGPVNKPAIYQETLKEPKYLAVFNGENNYHFLINEFIFQWDHYGRRCRFFSKEEGSFLREYKFCIRYPIFGYNETILASLQDDGVFLYRIEKETINRIGFYPFKELITGCRYGYFREKTLYLFPSRFDKGVIQWEKNDFSREITW